MTFDPWTDLAILRKEHAAMLANLTATQQRCSELLQEARDARAETRIERAKCDAMAARIVDLERPCCQCGEPPQ